VSLTLLIVIGSVFVISLRPWRQHSHKKHATLAISKRSFSHGDVLIDQLLLHGHQNFGEPRRLHDACLSQLAAS
jgi:hypothetical protein